jgi:phosphoribosylformylglycinamidine synthase I
MPARVGVVTFPGSLDDRDALRAVAAAGGEPVALWHADADLSGVDAVVLPGGFSYGDYLRAGAIAARSPIMAAVRDAALGGMPVLGICNGWQVLCETQLLPGALTRNIGLHFVCRATTVRITNNRTAWTSAYAEGERAVIPVKNMDGRFVASEQVLDELQREDRVIAYYDDTPNGSSRDIAGVANAAGNVVGIMPHPEHAIEALTGTSADGLGFFTSVLKSLVNA